MRKIKIFNKDYCSDVIDIFYGITIVQLDFYKWIIVLIGMIFLSVSFPNGYVNEFLTITLGDFENAILTGRLVEVILNLFFLCRIMQVIILWMGMEEKKVKANKITGNVIGTILVVTNRVIVPVVTADEIIDFFLYFIIIKLVLKAITRIFYIPTRYFGYFKVKKELD